MAETDFFEVTVKEAAHNDAGRGIARLSVDVMKKLELVSGDVIEIVGKRHAAAIVWPGSAEDIGFGILRIDGSLRANANAGIDEKVKIRKSEAVYATKVVIQPAQQTKLVGGERYLAGSCGEKRYSRGRAFVKISSAIPSHFLSCGSSRNYPPGPLLSSPILQRSNSRMRPLTRTKGNGKSPISRTEDIGGLERELQLVRGDDRASVASPGRSSRSWGSNHLKVSCSTARREQERPLSQKRSQTRSTPILARFQAPRS